MPLQGEMEGKTSFIRTSSEMKGVVTSTKALYNDLKKKGLAQRTLNWQIFQVFSFFPKSQYIDQMGRRDKIQGVCVCVSHLVISNSVWLSIFLLQHLGWMVVPSLRQGKMEQHPLNQVLLHPFQKQSLKKLDKSQSHKSNKWQSLQDYTPDACILAVRRCFDMLPKSPFGIEFYFKPAISASLGNLLVM